MAGAIRSAFTLVEILIVVVILGILASMVVPQFATATAQSAETATLDQLNKLRRGVGVYQARNDGNLPTVIEGDGTWGELVNGGDYFHGPPVNAWIGGTNARVVTLGDEPDPAFQTDHAWVYDPATGMVWAGGFDADDQPYPR